MATREMTYVAPMHRAAAAGEAFADRFSLFATLVMSTFAVAIAMAIVGMSQPSWLGFS